MDFLQLSDKLKSDIALPDAEDTWERVAKALTSLKQSCDARQFDEPSDVVQTIKTFQTSIINSMNSERTRLCLAALDLVDAVAVACEVKFEPLIPVLLPALLVLCGRTNKVIVNRTKGCIMSIVECTQVAGVLPYFLGQLGEKANTVRLVAAEAALACVKCCNPPDLEKEARAGDIESIIRKAARDANADVRKVGRELFGAYKILLPSRVDRFTAPLTPTIRKYLDIKSAPAAASKPGASLTRVKSMSALNVNRAIESSKAAGKHSRNPSVNTMATTSSVATAASKEPSRPRPASRMDRLQKSTTTSQPATRTVPTTKPVQPTRPEQPKKLVSQSGSAGPSRVIARPASAEPTSQAAIRPQRTMPTGVTRSLTTRPPVASGSTLNVSGPRRVPLPPPSLSQSQSSDKQPSRPNSVQGRRIPAKGVEKPTFSTSNSTTTSRTVTRTVTKAAEKPTSRPTRPTTKAVASSSSNSMPPPKVPAKARPGLTQPTLAQMARMKDNVVRKPAAATSKAVAPLAAKTATKAGSSSKVVAVTKTKAGSVLRDGAPRSNAKEAPVVVAKDAVVEEKVEQEKAEEIVEEEQAERKLIVVIAKEEEEEAGQVPQHLPAVVVESADDTLEGEDDDHDMEEVEIPAPGASDDKSPITPNAPITPPNPNIQLGISWNVHEAKTPISALLSSIQQGFEFSPASPLSPPQGYQDVQPLALF
ncbi:endo-1,3(4)-Beta-Glucanase chain A [Coprinopsis cinerea AmutBmut pab1-1]|nr:endo-1,3(4)-Beta-Glucanase chain A [Coprinopsis cinerea AmutBmut pab1-1]